MAEQKNNMEKELQGFEEDPEAIIHIESLEATLKKYLIGKRQTMIAHMDSGFKKFPSIHDPIIYSEWIKKKVKSYKLNGGL